MSKHVDSAAGAASPKGRAEAQEGGRTGGRDTSGRVRRGEERGLLND